MKSFQRNHMFWILFIFFVYIGLPVSILTNIVPFEYKFYLLTIGAIFVYIVCRLKKITNIDMGITCKNSLYSIRAVLPITLILAGAGVALWALGFSRMDPNESWWFFIFYIFISSPVQEFLYRGALPVFLQKLNVSIKCQLVLTSTLYSFVHIIYKDFITLLLTFFIGLIWFSDYKKSNNLLGVSISHAVLGVVTIVAGIID